jgi:sugar lactone lactonase YvrE
MLVEMPNVVVPGLGYPEGVRWHQGDLYFSDFMSRRVWRVTGKEAEQLAFVYGQPGGMAFLPDGTHVVVSMLDQALVTLTGSGPQLRVRLDSVAVGPANDLLADDRGRLYVGCFGFHAYYGEAPADGPLLRVDADGRVDVAAEGLAFANGMVLTSAGELLVAETFGARVSAFEVRPDGSLGNRRLFADLDGRGPDGMCSDDAGGLWVACPFSDELVHVDAAGGIVGSISTPGRHPIDCALGEDILYVGYTEQEAEGIIAGRATGGIEAIALGSSTTS